ncbi:precorrin-6y C5,15-methyltransferase (decarboxylating) subunit CbiE [Collinsella sp. An2]|uniref:precorrin-6y C5,15-methyltransferase (decarboxylating) subunit CbiE n=1 Tax=Collinsella sp. An2 TaxID=1965585 RepID=UPI000B36C010|nr:precorrin-6y C5,15-methyltransferase (decarboxylating) subunit CbiE [Collinsella sp. An2]OUP09140.1 hypothetical protein B5F33_05235 [Collinsella sp. An2]
MRSVTVIGCGPGAADLLAERARAALGACDVAVGSPRLLEGTSLPDGVAAHAAVRARDIASFLAGDATWSRACVLMSGDTGLFSGAAGVLRALADEPALADCAVETVPGISSAAYLASRLGRPWQDWRFASVHGAACDLAAEAARGGTLFLVTGGSEGPASVCRELVAAGCGDAAVTVAEQLSYPDERIVRGVAGEFVNVSFAPLNAMVIDFAADASRTAWPWVTPGIPDECFERGRVPMTKQEVRAVALAKLRVGSGDIAYDIGAGTGSVSVELGLLARAGRVFAIERASEALELIDANVRAFGLRNVEVVAGEAPQALRGLPAPDAVFIGGSAGKLSEILDTVRASGGLPRVCITCISLQTLSAALPILSGPGFADMEVSQVGVARARRVGSHDLMRALNPVFVVSARMVAEEEL